MIFMIIIIIIVITIIPIITTIKEISIIVLAVTYLTFFFITSCNLEGFEIPFLKGLSESCLQVGENMTLASVSLYMLYYLNEDNGMAM